MNENIFEGVCGQEEAKAKITETLSFFEKIKEYKKENINVPKGMIFYGEPGNGKTLVISKIIESKLFNTYIFNGSSNNIYQEFLSLFEEAKKNEPSIIIIEEIDLILDRDSRLIRLFQEKMDGISKNDEILFIAATNYIRELPRALLRKGRFDIQIEFPSLPKKDIFEILKYYLKQNDVVFNNQFDGYSIDELLFNCSVSDVKFIVDQYLLRIGKGEIKIRELIKIILECTNNCSFFNNECDYRCAIHEASHLVMINHYKDIYIPTLVVCLNDTSFVKAIPQDSYKNTFIHEITNVDISISGLIGEKIVLNIGSNGSSSDLSCAYESAETLINCGYFGIKNILKDYDLYERNESDFTRFINDKLIRKFFKEREKFVTKYLKKNKALIIKIANLIYEKKYLIKDEILTILNEPLRNFEKKKGIIKNDILIKNNQPKIGLSFKRNNIR